MEYIVLGPLIALLAAGWVWDQIQLDSIRRDIEDLQPPEIIYEESAEEFFDSVAEATAVDTTEVSPVTKVVQ